VTAQVQLLAVLRQIADMLYAPGSSDAAAAAGDQPVRGFAGGDSSQPPPPAAGGQRVQGQAGSGSCSSKAQWLLGQLDHWLLELSLGMYVYAMGWLWGAGSTTVTLAYFHR
jgi:hypothetical protein